VGGQLELRTSRYLGERKYGEKVGGEINIGKIEAVGGKHDRGHLDKS